MRHFLAILFCFLSVSTALQAQNLVPNSGFEDLINCPTQLNNVGSNATNGDVLQWFSATDGAPDYFNQCATVSSSAGVPNNFYGTQSSLNGGNAYAGFLAYGPDNARNYLSVQLNNSLVPGETYCVTFNLSLADFTYQAVADIGIYFSLDSVNTNNGGLPLSLTPQVTNNTGIIDQKGEWINISINFTATDAFEFITIGNFNNNTNTTVQDISIPGLSGPTVDLAYYYIDEVSVAPLNEVNIAISPNDVICESGEITLIAEGADFYEWTTVADPFTIIGTDSVLVETISSSQSYILTTFKEACSQKDTIDIQVISPLPTPGFDIVGNCLGFATTFTDTSINVPAGATYSWDFDNDGIAEANSFGQASFQFSSVGSYPVTLSISAFGGLCEVSVTDTVHIVEVCNICTDEQSAVNLITNGGFEQYNVCPNDIGLIENANTWVSATSATPDFFHSCSDVNNNVPDNIFGSVAAIEGSGYAGFYAFGNNQREYISTLLSDTLSIGQQYCVSFKVHHAPEMGYAVSDIGLYLSEDSINISTFSPLFFSPQITAPSDSVITFNDGWTTIEGTFTPNDTILWATIGNFNDDANTNADSTGLSDASFSDFSYYFIDDITISPIPSIEFVDSMVIACTTDSSFVGVANDAFCSYLWYAADTPKDTLSTEAGFNLLIDSVSTQNIVVAATYGRCTITDTLSIEVNNPPLVGFTTNTNCAGTASVFIDTSLQVLPNATYSWDFDNDGIEDSNAEDVAAFIYPNPGTYTAQLIITNAGLCADSTNVTVVVEACSTPCDTLNVVPNSSFENGLCASDFNGVDLLDNWFSPGGNDTCYNYFSSCINIALTSINTNPSDSVSSYTFSIQNICADTLDYVAFELPDGLALSSPANGSLFSGDVGNYLVSQPVPAPFPAIVFDASTTGTNLVNGASETFFFTTNSGLTVPETIQVLAQIGGGGSGNVFVAEIQTDEIGCNTPDIFSSCNGGDIVGVPQNALGTQAAFDGSNYLGLIAFDATGNADNQYISVALSDSLVVGDTYCVSMYVSLADSSDYAIDQLGAYFSIDSLSGNFAITQAPQINNPPNNYLLDTDAWMVVTDTFTATSNYTYLTIGNFNDYVSSPILIGDNSNGFAYYYIDNVIVSPMRTSVSNDVVLCAGESTTLNASTTACNSFWALDEGGSLIVTTDTSLTITPATSTIYYFIAQSGSCRTVDSVQVTVNNLPQIDAGLPIITCITDSLTLNAVGDGVAYDWTPVPNVNFNNFNISNPTLTFDATGNYWLNVENTFTATGCSSSDSILVKVVPNPTAEIINGDTLRICEGDFFNLNATGGSAYSWSPTGPILGSSNIADPIIQINDTTTFYVNVTNTSTNCSDIDSIVVIPQAAYVTPPTDTIFVCAGDSAILSPILPTTATIVNFEWSPAINLSTTEIATPTTSTTSDQAYTLTYTDDIGCVGTYNIFVNIVPVPNAGIDAEICEGGSVQLNATGGGISYQWSPGDGLSQVDIQNPVATPLVTTEYVVSVTYAESAGASCINTDTITVFVNSTGFTEAGDDVTICPGDTAQLNAIGGDNFLWSPSEGLSDTTISNPQAFPAVSTVYTLTTVNSITGCASIDSVLVEVQTLQAPTINILSDSVICAEPFVQYAIDFEILYDGCEELTPNVVNQIGASTNIFQDQTLIYVSAFVTARVDTLQLNYCSAPGVCDGFEVVFVYCDEPPMWVDDVLEADICNDLTYNFRFPEVLDPDLPEDALSYSTTSAANGIVTIDELTGSVIYEPNTGFVGTDSFELIVCDSLLFVECDTLSVNLTVIDNLPPFIFDTNAIIEYETATQICADFNEPEEQLVITNIIDAPENGTAFVSGAACVTYTPNDGFDGLDGLSIEVCDECGLCDTEVIEIGVLPKPNEPPFANDTLINLAFNQTETICLNITDFENDPFTLSINTDAANGALTILDSLCFEYNPDNAFSGIETIILDACDAENCTSITITINVVPPANFPPIVNDTSVVTPNSTSIYICPEIIEPEGDNYTLVVNNTPANGSAFTNGDCIIYGPNPGFVGFDTFTILTCDNQDPPNCIEANVTVEVLPIPNLAPTINDTIVAVDNAAPTIVCLNVFEPENDDFTISVLNINSEANINTSTGGNNDCFVFTPTIDYDNFTIAQLNVCDEFGNCELVNVIFISNDPPEAADITIFVETGGSNTECFDVVEPDGEDYTLTVMQQSPFGTAILAGDCLTYIDNGTSLVPTTVDLELCDELGNCIIVLAQIIVLPEDEVPTAPNLNFYVIENEIVDFCLTPTDPEGEPISATVVNAPDNGDVIPDFASGDYCYTYTPDIGFVGSDTIIYSLCDSLPIISCGEVQVSITTIADCINDTTFICMPNDSTLCPSFCLLTNPVVDILGSSASNAGFNPAASANCIDVSIPTGFNGLDTLNFVAQDVVTGLVDTSVVVAYLGCPAPIALADEYFVQSATPALLDITANDFLEYDCTPNFNPILVTPNTFGGTASVDASGQFLYQSDVGFQGQDTIFYILCNQCGINENCGNDTTAAIINVSLNLPPQANDTTVTIFENTTLDDFCLNITEPEDETYTLTWIASSAGGTVINIDGDCIDYTPPFANFTGTDVVQINIIDVNGNSNLVNITITIIEMPNEAPIVEDVFITTDFNTSVETCISVLEPNSDPYSVDFGIPTEGGAIVPSTTNDTCLTYIPQTGFMGNDTINVTVCDVADEPICVNAIIVVTVLGNEAPTAEDILETTETEVPVVACISPTDPEGDEFTVTFSDATNGSYIVNSDFCIEYTSNAGFVGTEIITAEICDVFGHCSTTSITIEVNEPNFAPNISSPIDTIISTFGQIELICIIASDTNIDDLLSYSIVGISPNEGTASISGNCITYNTPNVSTSDFISISVEVCDDGIPQLCTTSDVVVFLNAPPLVTNQELTTVQNTPLPNCLLINDANDDNFIGTILTTANNGNVSFTNDSCWLYIPDPLFVGIDSFYVEVCDQPYNLCDSALMVIEVLDGLIAVNDEVATENNVPITIDILDNDTQPEDFTVTIVANVSNGILQDNGDGTFTYIAGADFIGIDTFTYELCSSDIGCETAEAVITVSNALDAINDIDTTFVNAPIDIPILDNDIYPDFDNLTVSIINEGDINGFVSQIGTTGVYTYLPDNTFEGTDTFLYTIEYPGLGADTAMVIVTVTTLPSLPTVMNDSSNTVVSTPVNIAILDNDFDPNTGSLAVVAIVNDPVSGQAEIESDNTITYYPFNNVVGVDSFTYVACNPDLGNGLTVCDTATVYITITEAFVCEPLAYAALSPNGDGRNDFFVIDNLDCDGNDQNELIIFNRWGGVVFEASNYSGPNWWDGSFQGSSNLVPDGTYFYILKLTNSNTELQGFIEVHK